MKRATLGLLCAIFVGAPLVTLATVFTWTGIGNGWKNQNAPTGADGEDLVFGRNVNSSIPLPGNVTFNSLTFTHDDNFQFTAVTPFTLTLTSGVVVTSTNSARFDAAQNITVNIASAQTWALGPFSTTATLHGKLTGTGNLTITGDAPALVLSNFSGNPSDFSGTLTLSPSATSPIGDYPTLVFWGNDSVVAGPIAFTNGGILITHAAPVVGNAITLNGGSLPTGQLHYSAVRFRTWDGPATTLSGSITLANDTILQALPGWQNKVDGQYPNNTGARPLPGPLNRYPVLISGNIGESGGARKLNITGQGIVILAGTNTYTGGTNVGFSYGPTATTQINGNGSLIFANTAAIPATGAVQVGLAGSTFASGYAGIAASAVPGATNFASFLASLSPATSTGSIGIDSLTGNLPDTSPATISYGINLTGFTYTAAGYNGIRLGTATSVKLTGTITPQFTNVYNFGNGGGKLYVASNLANLTTSTSLQNVNQGSGLQLFLQGTNNSYSGGTTSTNGFIIFDALGSIPGSGLLLATGSSASPGSSYIGFTDAATGTTALSGSTLTNLLLKFDKPNTWGTIGFDSTNTGSPVTVTGLDLTGFNDGVFVGTNSAAILAGGITTPANILRLTATNGGTLTVNSTLAAPLSVVIGAPSALAAFSDGTVILNAANTYSGGTTVNSSGAITVAAGNNNAFGTGTITLQSQGGIVGLSATGASLNIPNAINFYQDTTGNGFTPTLMLTGANDFTLSGAISGPPATNATYTGVGNIMLVNPSPIHVTFSGNNSGYFGDFQVGNGTLIFDSNNAAGRGTIGFDSALAAVAFNFNPFNPQVASGNAPNPVIYGLDGTNGGTIVLPDGTNLTFNTDSPTSNQEFNGIITGWNSDSQPVSTTASLTFTATTSGGSDFYLHGIGNYTGGTTVTGQAVLGIGTTNAIGTGALTVSAPNGGVLLNTGVVLVNPLVFNSGGLGGLGTFAPSSVSGTGQTAGSITFGANQIVAPGIPTDHSYPGNLTLATDVAFATGGKYLFLINDPASAEGYSSLTITGNLSLSAITAGGFTIGVQSLDPTGLTGFASTIAWGTTYSIPIVLTAGTITGFNAANFTFDVSQFQGGQVSAANFSVTNPDPNHLYLNFTAVPEPSTYSLLVLGLGLAGLRAWRRSRRV